MVTVRFSRDQGVSKDILREMKEQAVAWIAVMDVTRNPWSG